MTLGERLKAYVETKGCSQKVVATALGIHPGYVNGILKGRVTKISLDLEERINQLVNSVVVQEPVKDKPIEEDNVMSDDVMVKITFISESEKDLKSIPITHYGDKGLKRYEVPQRRWVKLPLSVVESLERKNKKINVPDAEYNEAHPHSEGEPGRMREEELTRFVIERR